MAQTPRRRCAVVVTDLDNTLYDWFAMWHASFRAMLDEIVATSGLREEDLLPEIKQIFELYKTSEYAFLIQELPSLKEKYPGANLPEIFNGAVVAYRKARKETLRLYPGVLETLVKLKQAGCLIVGYTESMAFYTNYRMRTLGLDGLLDHLYSPVDHKTPDNLETELRRYEPNVYQLNYTRHSYTPANTVKPSPAVLLDILKQVGATPQETVYIGDNLLKDVSMAQDAGVLDIHAAYGESKDREGYDLLRKVTHWPDKHVEAERTSTVETTRPTLTINSFKEILDLIEPTRFIAARPEADGTVALALDAWKKTVDVQMHFNDLQLRLRNFAITVLLATLGAAGVAIKEQLTLHFWGWEISLAAPMLLAGLIGWGACYSMDRFGYHRLLYGAVRQGLFAEQRLRLALPETGLTSAIGKESPVTPQWTWMKRLPYPFGGPSIHSAQKIDLFYAFPALVLLVGMVATSLPASLRSSAKNNTAASPSPSPSSSPSTTSPASVVGPQPVPTQTPSPTRTHMPASESTPTATPQPTPKPPASPRPAK